MSQLKYKKANTHAWMKKKSYAEWILNNAMKLK